MKSTVIIVFWIVSLASAWAQQPCRTQVFDKLIHSLQVHVADQLMSIPCIEAGSDQQIEISFDALSPQAVRYAYSIVHCNADWTPSTLSQIEYLDGFQGIPIDDFANSMTTTVEYVNYQFRLPNEEVHFKVSGNYAVRVYPEDEPDQTAFVACFSIVEPLVSISGQIRGNTDIDTNAGHQQVDFSIWQKRFPITHPQSDLKIRVTQNNRTDNVVTDLVPTLISNDQIDYTNNRKLIFEAGNEFRRMEFLSTKYNGMHVEGISFHNPYYHLDLQTDRSRQMVTYQYDQDQDGRYFIHCSGCDDPDLEADYFVVHFALASDPLPPGKLYIAGELTQQQFSEPYEMHYNPESQRYEHYLMLKQGNYNYQYLFVPDGETKGRTVLTEGDFYQTENEYTIYVYYRPIGARFDRLIGVSTLKNQIQLY